MAEKESKIVNASTTNNEAALAYRSAQILYTQRNYQTQEEAKRQNIDLEPVRKEVQRKNSIAMAQRIGSQMEDKKDLSEFVDKLFRGGKGFVFDIYEVKIVEKTHDKADLEYHYCPLVQAWKNLGLSDDEIAKLCDSAMVGDLITAEELGYDLDIQKTIAHGDGYCKMVYTN